MNYKFQIKGTTLFLLILLINCKIKQSVGSVSDIKEFNKSTENVQPADNTIMGNGIWNNSALVFDNEVTEEKNTIADSILLSGCNFEYISGHNLNLNKEINDIGIYKVKNIDIVNCIAANIDRSELNLHRRGKDESTFGPILNLRQIRLINIGNDKTSKIETAVAIHEVQLAEMSGLSFKNSRSLMLHVIVGDPEIELKSIDFDGGERLERNDDATSPQQHYI